MIPYIQYGLGVDEDGVYIRYQNTERGKQLRRKLVNFEDFKQFIVGRMKKAGVKDADDLIIMCSSSMDFPEEYTKDKAVIKLAHDLR